MIPNVCEPIASVVVTTRIVDLDQAGYVGVMTRYRSGRRPARLAVSSRFPNLGFAPNQQLGAMLPFFFCYLTGGCRTASERPVNVAHAGSSIKFPTSFGVRCSSIFRSCHWRRVGR